MEAANRPHNHPSGAVIYPPEGMRKTPKISEKFLWIVFIWSIIVGAVFGFMIVYYWPLDSKYVTYAGLGLVVAVIPAIPLSMAAQRAKVINTIRRINKEEIPLAEIKKQISWFWMYPYWVTVHTARAIKKGYLHEYKYLVNEQLLVRI